MIIIGWAGCGFVLQSAQLSFHQRTNHFTAHGTALKGDNSCVTAKATLKSQRDGLGEGSYE
jgi:hypothetical protein